MSKDGHGKKACQEKGQEKLVECGSSSAHLENAGRLVGLLLVTGGDVY